MKRILTSLLCLLCVSAFGANPSTAEMNAAIATGVATGVSTKANTNAPDIWSLKLHSLSSGLPTPGVLTLLPDSHLANRTLPIGLDLSGGTSNIDFGALSAAAKTAVSNAATSASSALGTNYVSKPLPQNTTNFALLSAQFDGFEDFNRLVDANSRTEQNTISNFFTSGIASGSPFFSAVHFCSGNTAMFLRDSRWKNYNSPTNDELRWITNWVRAWAGATNTSPPLFGEAISVGSSGSGNKYVDAQYDMVWWFHRVFELDRAMGLAMFDAYKGSISNALGALTYSNHLDKVNVGTSIGGWGYRDSMPQVGMNTMCSALHIECCMNMADFMFARGENAAGQSYLAEIPVIVSNLIAFNWNAVSPNGSSSTYCSTNNLFAIITGGQLDSEDRPDIVGTAYLSALGVLPPEIDNKIVDRLIAGTPWGSLYSLYHMQISTNGTVFLQGNYGQTYFHQQGGGWVQFTPLVARVIAKKRPDISAMMVQPIYTNTITVYGGLATLPIHTFEWIGRNGQVTNGDNSCSSGVSGTNNIGSLYAGAIRSIKTNGTQFGAFQGSFSGSGVGLSNLNYVRITGDGMSGPLTNVTTIYATSISSETNASNDTILSLNPAKNAPIVIGNGGYTMSLNTASIKGMAFNNQTSDTGNLYFYYGNNANFAFDVESATLRFVKNMGESGALVVGTFDTSGNFIAANNITANATLFSGTGFGGKLFLNGSGTSDFDIENVGDNTKLRFRFNGVTMAELTSLGVLTTTSFCRATNGFATYTNNGVASAAITFPATTVNWTNTFNINIVIYIDQVGVTGTSITKNGQQIFAGIALNTTICLKPGDYFSETYTIGAPTARWEPR